MKKKEIIRTKKILAHTEKFKLNKSKVVQVRAIREDILFVPYLCKEQDATAFIVGLQDGDNWQLLFELENKTHAVQYAKHYAYKMGFNCEYVTSDGTEKL